MKLSSVRTNLLIYIYICIYIVYVYTRVRESGGGRYVYPTCNMALTLAVAMVLARSDGRSWTGGLTSSRPTLNGGCKSV